MDLLWVCLAVIAVHFKQLDPAQIAYAALGETDKILYVDSIKVNYLVLAKTLTKSVNRPLFRVVEIEQSGSGQSRNCSPARWVSRSRDHSTSSCTSCTGHQTQSSNVQL